MLSRECRGCWEGWPHSPGRGDERQTSSVPRHDLSCCPALHMQHTNNGPFNYQSNHHAMAGQAIINLPGEYTTLAAMKRRPECFSLMKTPSLILWSKTLMAGLGKTFLELSFIISISVSFTVLALQFFLSVWIYLWLSLNMRTHKVRETDIMGHKVPH